MLSSRLALLVATAARCSAADVVAQADAPVAAHALLPSAGGPAALVPWAAVLASAKDAPIVNSSCSFPGDLNEDYEGFVLDRSNDGISDSFLIGDRCATVIRPANKTKLGVVFCFHDGRGASSDDCASKADDQGTTLADLAMKNGFALVMLQPASGASGWDVPLGPPEDKWLTNVTTSRCGPEASAELQYWDAVMAKLRNMGTEFAAQRVYPLGFSVGAVAASYAATCLREKNKKFPSHSESYVKAFGAHSMGLFREGDHYLPIYPTNKQRELKACISGGTANQVGGVDFHRSSSMMAETLETMGAKVKTFYLEGGSHDEVDSWATIVNCLDDMSGRMFAYQRDAHPNLFVDLDADM